MFTQILKRPALAIVLSILILLLGGLGIVSLPIAQFPDIAPPTVYVSVAYPGASAKVLTDSVLIPRRAPVRQRFVSSSNRARIRTSTW
jgi:HAE1 family hydrophobic/amphiphilic exporter-1